MVYLGHNKILAFYAIYFKFKILIFSLVQNRKIISIYFNGKKYSDFLKNETNNYLREEKKILSLDTLCGSRESGLITFQLM